MVRALDLQLTAVFKSLQYGYVIVLNFIEIAQTAVEISQFLDFSKWQTPLSWILKIFNF